jgi:methionyl-tRNA synthetase
VIGQDILRFHAVYWPATSLSAGLELPKQVFGHGFSPARARRWANRSATCWIRKCCSSAASADAVRWYLLRDIPFGDDGDFQQQRFVDLVNNDLANTIGNMLNRTSAMARRWFEGTVPPPEPLSRETALAEAATAAITAVIASLERLDFRTAAESSLQLAIAANGYLNTQAPWSLIEEGGQSRPGRRRSVRRARSGPPGGPAPRPAVPELSARMLARLGPGALVSGARPIQRQTLAGATALGPAGAGVPLPNRSP